MPTKKRRKKGEGFLEGQLLVAMPLMSDKRFARSVIYMCAHSDEGAMGIIINQRAAHINFPDLLDRLNIKVSNSDDGIPKQICRALSTLAALSRPGAASCCIRPIILPPIPL